MTASPIYGDLVKSGSLALLRSFYLTAFTAVAAFSLE